ncbi:TMV resistance protein N-like isoform X2 [Vigna unguiculata]|uniref:TMV resistance protein N-like isoform X2 n=1 Tax=Vigna unguiculata TaxID=3917 RepID=UPI0010162020|nr:TMV resistance protein N-like isoform X2 [Vigna unguiculata]
MTSHQFLSMDNSSSSYKLPEKYDVLINFTGDDIHRKFVSHLDSVLTSVGISTFLHHQNSVKATHIQQPILKNCRVAIVVFTQTYSQSAWCLNQLQQIIKWHETYLRHVLPVYYEIQPSDVRLQKGDFGKALKATAQQTFSGQQLEDAMSRWSYALTKAANFFGWDENNHRSDAELVDKIVKSLLNLPVLSATRFPVGLQSHVEDLIRTINSKSREVCTIRICGQGGSGKTTLAKAIYHQIQCKFRMKSFIEDIEQLSGTRRDLRLQEQLLLDVLKTKVEIPSVDVGRTMIQERLSGKRVLIVLDHVYYFCELLNLLKYRHSFSEGTVIIITAEKEMLLGEYQTETVFWVEQMDINESLELLSWHAFREAKPIQEYDDLAKQVVNYCGGLPLTLELIGSSLFERTKEEWQRVIFGLEDTRKGYVTKILNGWGVNADIGIRVLMERNLIKIKKNNKLGMHPLLQQMGITISVKEPGKNRRLWFDKDKKYGTQNMQWLPVEDPFRRVHPTENSQYRHKKLGWISSLLFSSQGTKANKRFSPKRDEVGMSVNSEYLLQKLKWTIVHGFPSEYLHRKFYVHDAIGIDLKHSLLRLVWKKPQVLRWLKVLNLSHSKYLKETPDFSGLPSLEQLILKHCSRLRKVHRSIGSLNNLILLNLKDCTSLSNLPREIFELKSLRTLILSGCSMIDQMENDLVQMESLITLIAENTAVKEVPFSIVSSRSIGYISLHRFEGLSSNLFPSIIGSWMSPTMNPISCIHSFCMDMADNSWDDMAPLLSTLANLRSVLVACDTEFQLSEQVKNILVEYFANITEAGISKQHFRCSLIGVGAYHQFFNAVGDNIYEVLASSESCDVSLPVVNDPYCLAHMGEGHSVSFTVPQDCDMKGMVLCVVYLSTPKIIEPEFTTVLIVNYSKCTFQIHNHGTIICFNDEDWHGIMSNLESGDTVEIFVNFGNGLVVKNTAVYLICGESKNMEKASEPKHSLIRFIKKVVM